MGGLLCTRAGGAKVSAIGRLEKCCTYSMLWFSIVRATNTKAKLLV